MAVTVVVEDGSGVANANSYVTTAEIDAWVLTNPHDSTWAALAAAAKNGYAVMSCRVLNEQMNWDGWQTDDSQALDLPRSGMVDKNGNSIDNDEIPTEVKNAQCQLARLLAIEDRTADPDTAGFKEIGVGSIKLVIDKLDRVPTLADAVFNMLNSFGSKAVTKGVSPVIRI
jgi:hypothetical protein